MKTVGVPNGRKPIDLFLNYMPKDSKATVWAEDAARTLRRGQGEQAITLSLSNLAKGIELVVRDPSLDVYWNEFGFQKNWQSQIFMKRNSRFANTEKIYLKQI